MERENANVSFKSTFTGLFFCSSNLSNGNYAKFFALHFKAKL